MVEATSIPRPTTAGATVLVVLADAITISGVERIRE
jgi:hypothetical protein